MNNVARLFLTSLFLIYLNHSNLKAMWGDEAYPGVYDLNLEVVGAKLSGVDVCNKTIEDLDAIIAYRKFDQYLLTPDNLGNPEPDFAAYDFKKHHNLRCFYSDFLTEREPAHIRMHQNFLKIIKSFSSLSHTHPEFEVLFFFADDSVRFMNTHFQEQFQRIFQDDELSNLKNLICKLQAVSQAIDNKESRDQIKELENQVTQAFDSIPITMKLAHHFYLPAAAKKHADMLAEDYDHTTFAGRAALTRALICYGELLKTIPDKKTSAVAKACIIFRDKAVKVLPRRLEKLKNNTMSASYANMNYFLKDLHAYIFTPGAEATTSERIKALLADWGYKTNGKSTGKDSTDEEVPSNLLLSILHQMRTISGLTVRLPDVAFFDEAHSVWSNFECCAENYLLTADRKAISTLSPAEQSANEADLERIRKQRMQDLKRKHLKEWPAILKGYDFTKATQALAAITEINDWLGNVQKELQEGSYLGDDSYLSAMTKARLMMTRPFHVRLRLLTNHIQQNSRFDSLLSVYPLMTSCIDELSNDDFEALRLLGYTFAQTAKDNITTLSALKPFESQLNMLRELWAHPRMIDFNFEEILATIDASSDKRNESRSMAILMVKCGDALES